MIKLIQGKSFKGQDFEQPMGALNLLIGPNGSGKSSRSMALQFLANGYIMGIGKRNGDIFDACAKEGDLKVFAGCTVESDGKKTKFLKRLAKSADTGAVGLVLHVRDTKANVSQYAAAWASAQAPRLVDPDIFVDLSPTKQVEELFSLFPPEGDLSGLGMKVEAAREVVNSMIKNKLDTESLIQTLRQSIIALDLGTGTQADIEAEEMKVSLELDNAKAELAKAEAAEEADRMLEIERARDVKAKLEADAEHAKQMRELNERAEAEKAIEAQKFRDQAELLKQAKARETAKEEAIQAEKRILADRERAIKDAEERLLRMAPKEYQMPAPLPKPEPVPAVVERIVPGTGAGVEAIHKIISAMERAGCDSCMSLMIARRELKKITGIT
jgi:hypothetical protein